MIKKSEETTDCIENESSSNYEITYNVSPTHHDGEYEVNIHTPLGIEEGVVYNSTPESIRLDALKEVAKLIQFKLDVYTYTKAEEENKSVVYNKVRDLTRFDENDSFVFSVFDGQEYCICVYSDNYVLNEILTLLSYDKVSLAQLKEYADGEVNFRNLGGESGEFLYDLLMDTYYLNVDVTIDCLNPDILKVSFRGCSGGIIEEFDVEKLS